MLGKTEKERASSAEIFEELKVNFFLNIIILSLKKFDDVTHNILYEENKAWLKQ